MRPRFVPTPAQLHHLRVSFIRYWKDQDTYIPLIDFCLKGTPFVGCSREFVKQLITEETQRASTLEG